MLAVERAIAATLKLATDAHARLMVQWHAFACEFERTRKSRLGTLPQATDADDLAHQLVAEETLDMLETLYKNVNTTQKKLKVRPCHVHCLILICFVGVALFEDLRGFKRSRGDARACKVATKGDARSKAGLQPRIVWQKRLGIYAFMQFAG